MTAISNVIDVNGEERDLALIVSLFLTKTARYLMSITQKGLHVRGFENIPDYKELEKQFEDPLMLFHDQWFYDHFKFSKELIDEVETRVSDKDVLLDRYGFIYHDFANVNDALRIFDNDNLIQNTKHIETYITELQASEDPVDKRTWALASSFFYTKTAHFLMNLYLRGFILHDWPEKKYYKDFVQLLDNPETDLFTDELLYKKLNFSDALISDIESFDKKNIVLIREKPKKMNTEKTIKEKKKTFDRISIFDDSINVYLDELLTDRTTNKHILWATADYGFDSTSEMLLDDVRSLINADILIPRIYKSLEAQKERTKKKAEVFTPLWITNKMIDMCEENSDPMTWQEYVSNTFLEITCGEAPFVVLTL